MLSVTHVEVAAAIESDVAAAAPGLAGVYGVVTVAYGSGRPRPASELVASSSSSVLTCASPSSIAATVLASER